MMVKKLLVQDTSPNFRHCGLSKLNFAMFASPLFGRIVSQKYEFSFPTRVGTVGLYELPFLDLGTPLTSRPAIESYADFPEFSLFASVTSGLQNCKINVVLLQITRRIPTVLIESTLRTLTILFYTFSTSDGRLFKFFLALK